MFEIDLDSRVREQIHALPDKAGLALMEVLPFLELTPWNGAAVHKDNPDGALRQIPLGGGLGLLTYLILDDQRRVDLVDITWLGD